MKRNPPLGRALATKMHKAVVTNLPAFSENLNSVSAALASVDQTISRFRTQGLAGANCFWSDLPPASGTKIEIKIEICLQCNVMRMNIIVPGMVAARI